MHVTYIPKGKYGNRNFQYGRYSWNDVMKLNLYISCLHDYCADPNNIIFQVWKESQRWCVLKKIGSPLRENIPQFRWGNYTSASEFRFWIEGQNLVDRLILLVKMKKKSEKSASKNKHPIKFRFSNWSLQSDNPEKKVIPEKHAFGSYPFKNFSKFQKSETSNLLQVNFWDHHNHHRDHTWS